MHTGKVEKTKDILHLCIEVSRETKYILHLCIEVSRERTKYTASMHRGK